MRLGHLLRQGGLARTVAASVPLRAAGASPPPLSPLQTGRRAVAGGICGLSTWPYLTQAVSRRQCSTSAGVVSALSADAHTSGGQDALESHVARAEERLRAKYGPQAKLVLHRLHQQQSPDTKGVPDSSGPDVGEPGAAVSGEGPDAVYYRASATFRLLGFPVELAATKGRSACPTVDKCVQQALSSDVEFIKPEPASGGSQRRGDTAASRSGAPPSTSRQRYSQRHHQQQQLQHYRAALSPHQREFKAVADELRDLCIHFSRSVKFSIKPPPAAASTDGATQPETLSVEPPAGKWRCRVYLKDEWSAVARMSLAHEDSGASPREALSRAFGALRVAFRADLEAPEVMLAGVQELAALLAPRGKKVTAGCAEDEPASGPGPAHEAETGVLYPSTYTGTVTVEDAAGNCFSSQIRRQPSRLAAYHAAAMAAMRAESIWDAGPTTHLLDGRSGPVPLLYRLRWEFDALVHTIAQVLGKAIESVAMVTIVDAATVTGYDASAKPNQLFVATFKSEEDTVWQAASAGRYRVEVDCYLQALSFLIDQYTDLVTSDGAMFDVSGGGVLFPCQALLDYAVHRHDSFDLVGQHRGRWNCYALLGTVTSQLLGHYYQTHYAYDATTAEWYATVTVSDPSGSSACLLAQRSSKKKGEAWRLACLAALRENFPRQYESVLRHHPDVDLSGDVMARGSKYRALPRDQRIRHIGNLFALVAAFSEEDMGWQQLRVRLRNTSGDLGLPQWVAELEALVEGEGTRRVVAVSPPYPQARMARRVLTYSVAQQYFAKELAVYQTLDRQDSRDPAEDPTTQRPRVYQTGGAGLVTQLLVLLEGRHPSHAPLSWTLRLLEHPQRGGSGSDADRCVIEGDVGLEAQSAEDLLLKPLTSNFAAQILGNREDLLITEYAGSEGEGAVVVLTSALKGASASLGGPAAETLWTEYETRSFPSMHTSKELAVHLFNAFFGATTESPATTNPEASVGATAAEPVVVNSDGEVWCPVLDIQSTQLAEYWVSTVVLPRVGMLPIARCLSGTKKSGANEALLLAARKSFPRILHYLAKHDVGLSSLATEILTEPIVERLPEHLVDGVRDQLARRPSATVPRPLALLARCARRDYTGGEPQRRRRLRLQHTQASGGEHQCRIYMQPDRAVVKRGEVQLVGFGVSMRSSSDAAQLAALMALENLFESDLQDAEARAPGYCERPAKQ